MQPNSRAAPELAPMTGGDSTDVDCMSHPQIFIRQGTAKTWSLHVETNRSDESRDSCINISVRSREQLLTCPDGAPRTILYIWASELKVSR